MATLRLAASPVISSAISRGWSERFSQKPLKVASQPVPARTSQAVAVKAAVAIAPPSSTKIPYQLPTWARFELGIAPVFWEAAEGGKPTSGTLLTLLFNPEGSGLTPNDSYGIAFNGGFNTPIMCGGEPRRMTRRDRGPNCSPFFSIKINVPQHAKTMEFAVSDGTLWTDTFVIELEVQPGWQNQPMSFFNEGLLKELNGGAACGDFIFPDAEFVSDRCLLPGGLVVEEGQSCELPQQPGCMDPEAPNYDPLANVDDNSCAIEAKPANTFSR